MPTLNLDIPGTWTKVANASDTDLLISWSERASMEIATTAADLAPTVASGHVLDMGSAVNRGVIGPGYVWMRGPSQTAGRPSVRLVVTK